MEEVEEENEGGTNWLAKVHLKKRR